MLLNRHYGRGFTLLEVLLVVTILAALAGMAVPVLFGELERRELTESAEKMRSLVVMTRANAMITGYRYRIRWDAESPQPIVVHEPDPIDAPDEFEPVQAAWAHEEVLLRRVNCHEVLLGLPVQYQLLVTEAEEGELQEDFDEEEFIEEDEWIEEEFGRQTLVFSPTGHVDWATFVLAVGEPGEMAEDAEQLWLVLDGRTGEIAIQSSLTEEELAEVQIEREKLLNPLETPLRSITAEREEAEQRELSTQSEIPGVEEILESEIPGSEMPDISDIEEEMEKLLR